MVNHDLYNETSNLYAKQWMKLAEMDDYFPLFFCTHSYSVRSTSARAKADRQEFFIRIFLHLNFDCCNADWDFLFWDKNICETHRWLARSFTFVCKNTIFFFSQKFPFILDVIDNIFTVTMADYKTKRLVIAWQVAYCVIWDAWILYIILHRIHKIVLYALFNYNGNT